MVLMSWKQFLQVYLMVIAFLPIAMLLISWACTCYFISKEKHQGRVATSASKAIENFVKEMNAKEEKKNESEDPA